MTPQPPDALWDYSQPMRTNVDESYEIVHTFMVDRLQELIDDVKRLERTTWHMTKLCASLAGCLALVATIGLHNTPNLTLLPYAVAYSLIWLFMLPLTLMRVVWTRRGPRITLWTTVNSGRWCMSIIDNQEKTPSYAQFLRHSIAELIRKYEVQRKDFNRLVYSHRAYMLVTILLPTVWTFPLFY